MIFKTVKVGITVDGEVMRKPGQLFKLTEPLEKDFGNLSGKDLIEKQTEVYGEVLFERATLEEIVEALKRREIAPGDLSTEERKEIDDFIAKKEQRIKEFFNSLRKK